MLQRGFGVHHSGEIDAGGIIVLEDVSPPFSDPQSLLGAGLLPILKEMVEILFQEGLIKVEPVCPERQLFRSYLNPA